MAGGGGGGDGGATPPTASLGPGFRFHPTDEELVRYYLTRKVLGKPVRFDCIAEIDLYRFDPWELPGMSHLKTRDLEWYFFTALDRKYGHGCRTNRATGHGYWKTTGKDQPIFHQARSVGMRKTLVYHAGRAPHGERTNWVMHEYRLEDEELAKKKIQQDTFVLCRIFEKSGAGPKNGEQYGAPFVEEEWEDESNGTTLLKKNVAKDAGSNGVSLTAVEVNTMAPSSYPQHDIHNGNVASEAKHVALGIANTDRTLNPCHSEQLLLENKDGYMHGAEFSLEDCIEMNDVNDPIDVGRPSCSYGSFIPYQDFLCRAENNRLNHAEANLAEDQLIAEILMHISDDDDKLRKVPTKDSCSPSSRQLRLNGNSFNAVRKGFIRKGNCKFSIKMER